jgi:hypothetical protein
LSYIQNPTSLNRVFKKEIIVTSTSDKQDLTTNYDVVNGSLITYVPSSNWGDKVAYEFNTTWSYKDSTSKIIFKLVEYNTGTSSWDDINGSFVTIKSLKQGTDNISYKYVFDKWSGSKQLRLECKDTSTSFEGYLHSNYDQDQFYDPIVTCSTIY